ncbi:tripartite motif-containing protein 10-like isoform X2 [Mauremys mutica]|nr:tripartite motif-containing protein 10-like isoform X2 [Mauremys mutica]XP_044838497.1 tripartite motif-containing protein 10-like isoform X2 [Mauremys mutica]XP_044838498.1 tripartite motif-containing protein 10-like isoform X2 [Mauremys mutica]
MAARSQVKDLQEAVICSICLASFNDSVILIKCGHNFCRSCITQYCKEFKTSPPYPCPQCREPFREGEFQPNRELRNVVEIAKKIPEPRGKKACEKHEELLKLFCEVDQTLICLVCRESHSHKDHSLLPVKEAALDYKEQIQRHLESLKKERDEILSYKSSGENTSQELLKQLKTERQKIVLEFQELHQFLEEQERLLLAHLEELNKEIEKRRAEYVAKLSEELSSFSSLISEMEQKCQLPASEFLQDIKGTLSRCERETFQNPVAFSSELKWRIWESSQRNASLETIVKNFKDSLSSRQRLDKANVTLDPDTAHPELILSADRRSVRWELRRQDLPDNPERFDNWTCVLGCEGFTSGRHYWEVEVEVEEEWGVCAVGVARASVSRKGGISFTPERGIWVVWCIRFPPSRGPRRIRVYLDYERGQVAFFDAGTGDPMVTVPPASFAGERICPFFLCAVGSVRLL